MSDQVFWVLEVTIAPGKLDDFKAVAGDLIAATEKEPGTLGYEYYLSADSKTCHICERYRDSAAVMIHIENFGNFADRFLAACTMVSMRLYGNASEEVKAQFSTLDPACFVTFAGINR